MVNVSKIFLNNFYKLFAYIHFLFCKRKKITIIPEYNGDSCRRSYIHTSDLSSIFASVSKSKSSCISCR